MRVLLGLLLVSFGYFLAPRNGLWAYAQTSELVVDDQSKTLSAPITTETASAPPEGIPPPLAPPPEGEPIFNREDPFEPPRVILQYGGATTIVRPKDSRDLTDLEKYDLSEISLLGVLWNVSRPRALVQAGGKTYTLYRNTRVGRLNGRVSAIFEGAVEVTEVLEDEVTGRKEKEVRYIEFKKIKPEFEEPPPEVESAPDLAPRLGDKTDSQNSGGTK